MACFVLPAVSVSSRPQLQQEPLIAIRASTAATGAFARQPAARSSEFFGRQTRAFKFACRTSVRQLFEFYAPTLPCRCQSDEAPVKEFADKYKSEDPQERSAAIRGTRAYPGRLAIPMLLQAAKDVDAACRFQAVSSIASFGQVEGLDEAAVAMALEDSLFNEPDATIQAAAADAIGALKLARCFPALQDKLLQSADWSVRTAIVAALGELKDPRGYDLIVSALRGATDEADIWVKLAAIVALGELGDKRAVELLEPLVEDEDFQVSMRARQALDALQ
eukprot:tig00000718_g3681.t1